ncbi:MAG: Uncharacterised protein [Chloroflexota bacterium]|nr:MAG: Uncharacterised protein [Chloroflexota bacterium]
MVQIKKIFMAITLSLSVIGCVSLPDESKSSSENIVVPNTPTPERDILATLDAIDQLIIAARMTATAPTSTPVPVPTSTPVPVPTSTPIPVPTSTPVPVVDPTCTNRYSPTIPTVYLSSTTACKTENVTITWDVEKGTSDYFMNINLNNLSPYDYANGHIKFRIWNQNKTQYVDWYKRITPVYRATIDEVGLSDFRELIPNTIMTVGEIQLTRFDVGDY